MHSVGRPGSKTSVGPWKLRRNKHVDAHTWPAECGHPRPQEGSKKNLRSEKLWADSLWTNFGLKKDHLGPEPTFHFVNLLGSLYPLCLS